MAAAARVVASVQKSAGSAGGGVTQSSTRSRGTKSSQNNKTRKKMT